MKFVFNRRDAKAQRREAVGFIEVCFSLTPGFSQVLGVRGMEEPFQRFLRAYCKPLKRLLSRAAESTPLKWGVNEMTVATQLIF
jgi:hypothetical protein